jgi:hypothetical protein
MSQRRYKCIMCRKRMGPYRCLFCRRRVCLECRCECRNEQLDEFHGNVTGALKMRRIDR